MRNIVKCMFSWEKSRLLDNRSFLKFISLPLFPQFPPLHPSLRKWTRRTRYMTTCEPTWATLHRPRTSPSSSWSGVPNRMLTSKNLSRASSKNSRFVCVCASVLILTANFKFSFSHSLWTKMPFSFSHFSHLNCFRFSLVLVNYKSTVDLVP